MGIRKAINESPHGAAQVGDSIYKQSDMEGWYEEKDGEGKKFLIPRSYMVVEEVKAWFGRTSINPIGKVKE